MTGYQRVSDQTVYQVIVHNHTMPGMPAGHILRNSDTGEEIVVTNPELANPGLWRPAGGHR